MSDLLAPPNRFVEIATAHHEIRALLDRFDQVDVDRIEVAERLCLAMARHRSSVTEVVLRQAAVQGADHEQQARLLMVATHGAEGLVDRLRLPARDPRLVGHLVEGLRTLVREHERLEHELVGR